jgi:S1-C subfamily serine protease
MKTIRHKIFAAVLIICFTGPILRGEPPAEPSKQIEPQPAIETPAANHRIPAKEALVKIYSVANRPDYFRPWNMTDPLKLSGSGAIIADNLILTNAHVVANHSFIEVRRYGQWQKYPAKVAAISHEADLALLSTPNPEFFAGVTPLEFGELPELHEEVMVLGFPAGGDSLSITKGIVSRIENSYYVHSSRVFLAGQIDAAINPGNSGGPVLTGGKIVGVVMQSWQGLENTGYMVPVPIIRHFLKDIADGRYDGFPFLNLSSSMLENPDMKRFYQMGEYQNGVLVTHIGVNSPASGLLSVNDVLLAVDGFSIADDGTIEFRPEERTHFSYVVQQKQIGDSVSFKILRKGNKMTVNVPLTRSADGCALVEDERYEQKPRYFIFGGIIFTPLTKNLLLMWGTQSPPGNLSAEASNYPSENYREPVVAIQALPDEINRGYHGLNCWLVTEVNGKKIRDFDAFYKAVNLSDSEFVVLKDKNNNQIIIDRKKELEARERILKRYQIPSDRSPDLKGK